MHIERHEWDIHALSAGLGADGREESLATRVA